MAIVNGIRYEVWVFSKLNTVLSWNICPSFNDSVKKVQELFVSSTATYAIIVCSGKGRTNEKFRIVKGEQL